MDRGQMINELVDKDIEDIKQAMFNDDYFLLDAVLRGEGWKQYNNLTDDEVKTEYDELTKRKIEEEKNT